jgi:hypothetical protein
MMRFYLKRFGAQRISANPNTHLVVRESSMQNNDPKSEKPAMQERAAKDRDQKGRQPDTVPHQHGPTHAGRGTMKHEDAESEEKALPDANK